MFLMMSQWSLTIEQGSISCDFSKVCIYRRIGSGPALYINHDQVLRYRW